jgi:hypothetical protein
MVRFHISAKKNQKFTCWTPLAANRTPNRMDIRMENRTCRQPLAIELSNYRTIDIVIFPSIIDKLIES